VLPGYEAPTMRPLSLIYTTCAALPRAKSHHGAPRLEGRSALECPVMEGSSWRIALLWRAAAWRDSPCGGPRHGG
jgi:hypothetical protein